MPKWVAAELRIHSWAAVEGSCAELDPRKHISPPGTCQQRCRVCRVRADQKEKPNKTLSETHIKVSF